VEELKEELGWSRGGEDEGDPETFRVEFEREREVEVEVKDLLEGGGSLEDAVEVCNVCDGDDDEYQ